jgi:hypothetical protein
MAKRRFSARAANIQASGLIQPYFFKVVKTKKQVTGTCFLMTYTLPITW